MAVGDALGVDPRPLPDTVWPEPHAANAMAVPQASPVHPSGADAPGTAARRRIFGCAIAISFDCVVWLSC
jgi:hypothetical protein